MLRVASSPTTRLPRPVRLGECLHALAPWALDPADGSGGLGVSLSVMAGIVGSAHLPTHLPPPHLPPHLPAHLPPHLSTHLLGPGLQPRIVGRDMPKDTIAEGKDGPFPLVHSTDQSGAGAAARGKPCLGSGGKEGAVLGSELIPGLPDDVALLCLVRLRRADQKACSLVCSEWRRLFRSRCFYQKRKDLGFLEPTLVVRVAPRSGQAYEWYALIPEQGPGPVDPGFPELERLSESGDDAEDSEVGVVTADACGLSLVTIPAAEAGPGPVDPAFPELERMSESGDESEESELGDVTIPLAAAGDEAEDSVAGDVTAHTCGQSLVTSPGAEAGGPHLSLGMALERPMGGTRFTSETPAQDLTKEGFVLFKDSRAYSALRLPDTLLGKQGRGGGQGVAVSGGDLYIIGGMAAGARASRDVFRLRVGSKRWEKTTSMRVSRAYAGCWVLANGDIVVAGGCTDDLREISSSEIFNINTKRWRGGPSLPSEMTRFDSVMWRGKLLLSEGWHWPFHFSPRGFVFELQRGAWELMNMGLSEGWTGPAVVWREHLMGIVDKQRGTYQLSLYNPSHDTWHPLEGSELPHGVHPPWAVSLHDNTLYIVGKHVTLLAGVLCEGPGGDPRVSWSSPFELQAFQGSTCSLSRIMFL